MVSRTLRTASCLLGVTVAGAPLHAQGPWSPRADLSIGAHTIRTVYQGVTSAIESAVNESNYLASLGLGLGISRVVTGDVAYRSSFGDDWTLRVMTLGITVRSDGRAGSYFRLALGAIWSDKADECTASFGCPGTQNEGQPVYEFAIGTDFRLGSRVALGPVLWLSRSFGGLPSYRSLGVGVHLGLF